MARRQAPICVSAVRPGREQPLGAPDRSAETTTMLGRNSACGEGGGFLPANEDGGQSPSAASFSHHTAALPVAESLALPS